MVKTVLKWLSFSELDILTGRRINFVHLGTASTQSPFYEVELRRLQCRAKRRNMNFTGVIVQSGMEVSR